MKKFVLISLILVLHTFLWAEAITKESIKVDTFFTKYRIEDKYRWLEDINSSETKEWIVSQNKICRNYLSIALTKTSSFNAIDTYTYAEFRNPIKRGKYYFSFAYYNNMSVPALYYQSKLNDEEQLLVDPNYISKKDIISLGEFSVSKDSKLLAYEFSRNGSDWKEVKVVSLQSGIDLKDHLTGLKFSTIAWLGNGFFYSTFSQDNQFGETHGQKVLYHKLGDQQQQDKLIFEKKNDSSEPFNFQTTTDERFFIIKEINKQTRKTNVFYIDYYSVHPELKPLLINFRYSINILDSHDGKFIATTFKDSNNGSIVEVDPLNPLKWREIVGEFSEALMQNVIPFTDRIVGVYQSNQHAILTVFDYSGAILYNQVFPVATSVSGMGGQSTDEDLLYILGSYTIPPVVFKFNIKTFKNELTEQTAVTFDFKDIVYKEVDYLTKDSTSVPMILVYKKGLKLNGSNPTILKAYGGFGIVSPPSFDPGIVYFIENGGIFAFANIRGGGDKGKDWARKGRGINKQNSFNDFISAAEYLIKNNYTCKEKLAATGASNGGLVVAVAAIQRPDLFKTVVPEVAPLDMIRLEKFTVGHWNTSEYGTVKDSLEFKNLLDYSPYHNIRPEINYPSMLVVTSENDDRVPPFQSYKFVAELQNRTAQKNPVILKIEKKSGHYGASTLNTSVKATADIYGFIMYELTKKE